MAALITIANKSGATQSVAVLVVDPQSDAFPLVWKSASIPNGASSPPFDCDTSPFGLGWGVTNAAIAEGVQFTCRQVKSVGSAGATDPNYAPLVYRNGAFEIDMPYPEPTVPAGEIMLASDKSFTVLDAQADNSCIALFLQTVAVMAQPLAPGTEYPFAASKIIFYLTVTDASQGTAVQQIVNRSDGNGLNLICETTPTPVTFPLGKTELTFTLTENLTFQPSE